MRVIQEENYRGHQVTIGETVKVKRIGRSPIRQWTYRVLINQADVSDKIIVGGQKPREIVEGARRFIDQRSFSNPQTV